MKQKTAVEWLVEQLKERGYAGEFPPHLLFEQAKAMEQDQIKVAWLNSLTKGDYCSAEEYYQSIYGK
jgi:hypothetical protein